MAELVVVVPSRGRPDAVVALVEAFRDTCALSTTEICLALDQDDPRFPDYGHAVVALARDDESDLADFGESRKVYTSPWRGPVRRMVWQESGNMVSALNKAAEYLVPHAFAIGFMGDDHRPRTKGWDARYLEALRELGTGVVYGNDLYQGHRLPTQVAMTADIVRALGYMAPPTLRHLFVDNTWLRWGKSLDRIRYLPDVIVEHRHPHAGKAAWDDNYARVNSSEVAQHDEAAFNAYCAEQLDADLAKVRAVMAVPA